MDGLEHQRVGTAQRTTVLDLLSRALEEGYLDLEEYEGRLVRVTESKSVADLYSQVADLPPQFRWDPRMPLPPDRRDQQRESADSAALVGLILGVVSIPTSLCFGAGAIVGAAGVIFARRGMRLGGSQPKAVTGLILGVIGIALSIAFVVALLLTPTSTTTNYS
jgi:hypothetical protein